MIGIKGLEEGKNGITLIEDKVVMRQKKKKRCVSYPVWKVFCLLPS